MIETGRNLRYPLSITDMIEAIRVAATARGVAGELLVVAGERAVTTRELIDAFCDAFDQYSLQAGLSATRRWLEMGPTLHQPAAEEPERRSA
jgi:nucleoside-diphosphate-sugar epimerase